MNGGMWKLVGVLTVMAIPFVLGLLIGGSWGTSMAEEDCDCGQVEEEAPEEAADGEEISG
ncbi:hypothetical protein ACFP47_11520 [Nesterenkonia lacusekhoensis]|uniref:Uncharacterized protein n=1 Tax=Nesterenkonia lacusekhoensis TaxID=150832 RepID=A0ABS4T4W1_9MICC|nr:hypothetical protein [Nesterenkonia lacusekhoensis]MBP2319489.1 hypothetical protein [Nesterenkonia lacusekhoensis]